MILNFLNRKYCKTPRVWEFAKLINSRFFSAFDFRQPIKVHKFEN